MDRSQGRCICLRVQRKKAQGEVEFPLGIIGYGNSVLY